MESESVDIGAQVPEEFNLMAFMFEALVLIT